MKATLHGRISRGTQLRLRGADVAWVRALLAWYRRTARDLPWRRTRDPYRIWLSEIMLQQTRVATVVDYYNRFVAAFPTVEALAGATEQRVLKLWAGLGYYSRAHNLHRAARIVARERRGLFPASATHWQKLPGVGRYTAGAIASISTREPVPAVDGNVKRVLARFFCVRDNIDTPKTQARLWNLAEQHLPPSAAGDFNQGLMELGARVCTPRRPRCGECPVQRWCAGFASGTPERLPHRRAKRPVRKVESVAAAIRRQGRLLLVRRPAGGPLAGMWTLPGGELKDGESQRPALRACLQAGWDLAVAVGEPLGTVEHQFSHRRLRVHTYACDLAAGSSAARAHANLRWVTTARVDSYPLASLDRKLLRLILPTAPTGLR